MFLFLPFEILRDTYSWNSDNLSELWITLRIPWEFFSQQLLTSGQESKNCCTVGFFLERICKNKLSTFLSVSNYLFLSLCSAQVVVHVKWFLYIQQKQCQWHLMKTNSQWGQRNKTKLFLQTCVTLSATKMGVTVFYLNQIWSCFGYCMGQIPCCA